MKIADPVCERIFEQTKHRIVTVLISYLTVLSYLNLSSVISRCKHHFYPANGFWENRKPIFIAEPRSEFNCCYEQRTSKSTIEYYL